MTNGFMQTKVKQVTNITSQFWSQIQAVLLPAQCPVTGDFVQEQGSLSPAAWASLDFITPPYCSQCGTPYEAEIGDALLCGSCVNSERYQHALIAPGGLDTVRSALKYDDVASKLILMFKYADRQDLAKGLARLMLSASQRHLHKDNTIIVPVPLHPKRLRERKFNQSALLARQLSALSGIPSNLECLERLKPTKPQQGLSRKGRQRNVEGAFRVRPVQKPHISAAHIILVDDVLTTGETLKACARVLKKANVATVNGLTVARVVRDSVAAI